MFESSMPFGSFWGDSFGRTASSSKNPWAPTTSVSVPRGSTRPGQTPPPGTRPPGRCTSRVLGYGAQIGIRAIWSLLRFGGWATGIQQYPHSYTYTWSLGRGTGFVVECGIRIRIEFNMILIMCSKKDPKRTQLGVFQNDPSAPGPWVDGHQKL